MVIVLVIKFPEISCLRCKEFSLGKMAVKNVDMLTEVCKKWWLLHVYFWTTVRDGVTKFCCICVLWLVMKHGFRTSTLSQNINPCSGVTRIHQKPKNSSKPSQDIRFFAQDRFLTPKTCPSHGFCGARNNNYIRGVLWNTSEAQTYQNRWCGMLALRVVLHNKANPSGNFLSIFCTV